MPVTKSAIKSAKQSRVRAERLLPFKTHMKTMLRSVSDLAKEGKKSEAAALLPKVYTAIDAAAKKRIIHRRTANRRKSLVARLVK